MYLDEFQCHEALGKYAKVNFVDNTAYEKQRLHDSLLFVNKSARSLSSRVNLSSSLRYHSDGFEFPLSVARPEMRRIHRERDRSMVRVA
jgi:hypothetical protein